VTEESAEIFDDLYLGLRAGGAIRKQRRGEPLTQRTRGARRWQRLSRGARPARRLRVGLRLGFTSAASFGRWRKASAREARFAATALRADARG
jgi:hypothetical protein